jgi:hypothetical protein
MNYILIRICAMGLQNAVSQIAEQGQQQQLIVPSCKSLPDSCFAYKNSGYARCRLKIIPLYIVTY